MTDADTPRRKVFTGWHALACFVGFFGLMFAVNGVFLYQAITSFPGEDVKKSYLQGLNYNDALATRAEQADTGWRAEMGVDGEQFIFRLKDEQGNPVGGQHANVTFRRLTRTQDDTSLDLQGVEVGEFVVSIEALSSGRWEAIVNVYETASNELRFTAHKSVQMK